MFGTLGGDIDAVDRTFALAAAPRARRTSFPRGDGSLILAELGRVGEGTILPRRLDLVSSSGERVSLTLADRRLVAVDAVAPAELWTGLVALPAAVDAGSAEALLLPCADSIAAIMERAPVLEIRQSYLPPDPAPDPAGVCAAGAPLFADLLEHIAAQLRGAFGDTTDRAAILTAFYNDMRDLARLILTPERRTALPGHTPDYIRLMFSEIGPRHIRHGPGDAPEIVVFENGAEGDDLTVKIADETRLCIVHASGVQRAPDPHVAVWRLKAALDWAAQSTDPSPNRAT